MILYHSNNIHKITAMPLPGTMQLSFASVETERNIFYLRAITRLSFWGLPIGFLAYIFLLDFLGFTLETIILAFLIGWSANWLLTKFKMYQLYGRPGKTKTAIFEFSAKGFASTLGDALEQFSYSDISRIEKIGNFLIIWLKQTYKHNNKYIGIPIYSSAFCTINREEFIAAINTYRPTTEFTPTINTLINA
jgi:hypothetical protein